MKTKFLLFFLLLCFGWQQAPAAGVDAVTRREIGRTLSRIVAREVSGGFVRIEGVDASRKRVRIYTSVGLSYYPFREQNLRAMYDSVRAVLPPEYRKASIELYSDKREVRGLIPMAYRTDAEFRKLLRKKKVVPFVNRSQRPLVVRQSSPAAPTQGLSGRHIALWQSHGRYFDQPANRWKWQRSRLWMTCEDLYTQSYVLPYLVPMLENAGACVMLPRERDVQKYEVLADNDAAGQYAETDGPEKWQPGGVGFAHTRQVYRTGENPFRDGTTRRVRTVAGGAESRAAWRADIPERGEYAVYVSYETVPGSTDDAQYTVHHLGGESTFAVNQTMGSGTWIYLGHFLFGPGEQSVVTLTNRSRQAGRIVTADAVKIGGGYGNVARSVSDSLRRPGVEYAEETSGYPRFCEGARYWLQWAGFDPKVYTPKENADDYKDDYMSRAHWVNALMGGSERMPDSTGLRIPVDMALAFHSDAGVRLNDETIGTLGIFYTRENKGRFEGGADRYRSRDLTDIVMTQIVSDIRRTCEPEWNRRGLWNRAYYEARVPGAPTMLLELLSHQNFADMRYGSDPRFKFLVSRAIYKGILQYISSQYGLPYVVQPLPVEALSTHFAGEGKVAVSWSPVIDSLEVTAAPTGYVVYTRIDDGGFDNGRYTDKPCLLSEQEPGRIYSYKVTAVNEGGESFPSEVVAACRMPDEKGNVLVVNGFDRISAPLSMRRDSLAGFYTELDGGVPDKQDISFIGGQQVFDLAMARCEVDSIALGACNCDYETEVIGGNTFDYPRLHGASIVRAGYSFCSASAAALAEGEVKTDDYFFMDVIFGKQCSVEMGRGTSGVEFRVFPEGLRRALGEFTASGRSLFVSGSFIATDPWRSPASTDEERAFVKSVLRYDYRGGQASRRGEARIVASPARMDRERFYFNTEPCRDFYPVEAPDALRPVGGGVTVMRYDDGDQTAAVGYTGDYRSLAMGFPFEAIVDEGQRDRLMQQIMNFLEPRK